MFEQVARTKDLNMSAHVCVCLRLKNIPSEQGFLFAIQDLTPISSIDTVSKAFDLTSEQLKSRSRRKLIVDARSILARVAVRNHGYKGIAVAEALSLSPSSVSRIVERGENILLCRLPSLPNGIKFWLLFHRG